MIDGPCDECFAPHDMLQPRGISFCGSNFCVTERFRHTNWLTFQFSWRYWLEMFLSVRYDTIWRWFGNDFQRTSLTTFYIFQMSWFFNENTAHSRCSYDVAHFPVSCRLNLLLCQAVFPTGAIINGNVSAITTRQSGHIIFLWGQDETIALQSRKGTQILVNSLVILK